MTALKAFELARKKSGVRVRPVDPSAVSVARSFYVTAHNGRLVTDADFPITTLRADLIVDHRGCLIKWECV